MLTRSSEARINLDAYRPMSMARLRRPKRVAKSKPNELLDEARADEDRLSDFDPEVRHGLVFAGIVLLLLGCVLGFLLRGGL